MLEFYHGTVDAFLPAILNDGLQPVEGNMWDATKMHSPSNYNPKRDDPKGYVHFTPDAAYAAMYALGKANYFRAEPGSEFNALGMTFTKGTNAPMIPNAKPVLLKAKFTDAEQERIYLDTQDSRGIQFAGKIPHGRIAVLSFNDAVNIQVDRTILAKMDEAYWKGIFKKPTELVKVFV